MQKYIQFKGFKWYYIRGLKNIVMLALALAFYVYIIKAGLDALLIELGG